MTKTIVISILLAGFFLAALLLSTVGVLNFTTADILCFLLILAGISFTYVGFGDKSDVIVFLGTILFLIGTLLLINFNFELKIERTALVPVVLLISAAGFFMLFINRPSRKYNFIISIMLFITASTIILIWTEFELNRFIQVILPLLNIYWPVFVVFLLLVILLWKAE